MSEVGAAGIRLRRQNTDEIQYLSWDELKAAISNSEVAADDLVDFSKDGEEWKRLGDSLIWRQLRGWESSPTLSQAQPGNQHPFAEDTNINRLPIHFTVDPIDDCFSLLWRSLRVFWQNIGMITMITLVVWLPVDAVKNFILYHNGMQDDTLAFIKFDAWISIIFGSLVSATIICSLVSKFNTGRRPALFEAFNQGVAVWGRMIGANLLSGLLIGLTLILLIIPGIIYAIRFSVVEPVVALEGKGASGALSRSRQLVAGYGWRIFFAFLFSFLLIGVVTSLLSIPLFFLDTWWLCTIVNAISDIVMQLLPVLALMIYLGICHARQQVEEYPMPPPYHPAEV